MGAQNFKSLKYWTDDELGFMTGLFYSTKILLKTKQKVRLHKNLKNEFDIYEHVQKVELQSKTETNFSCDG